MHSLIDNRKLLRFTLAGALALTAAACSRSDRADAGRDTSQTASVGSSDSQVVAGLADTATPGTSAETTRPAPSAAPQKENVSGYQPMGQDTGSAVSGEASKPTANTDSAAPPAPVAADTAAPESDTVVVGDSANVGKPGERLEEIQASEQANADSLAGQGAAPVRPPEDSSETIGVATDTSGSGVSGDTAAPAAEMVRDTSTVLAQGDISAQRSEVTVETADTTESIHVQIDTATAESPAEIAQATSADTAAVAAAQVPSTGNIATGPEAVALMSREGRRCTVVDPDRSQDAQWDMAGSPASMNPCGTGTMTLPRVRTEE